MTLSTNIIYFGQQVTSLCDHKCEMAWGQSLRPYNVLDSENEDDWEYLADHELEDYPTDMIDTTEGGEGKPMYPEAHNKWCVRECERCVFADGWNATRELPDFSKRIQNINSRE